MERYTGHIEQIIFQNEDSGFVVANFVTEDDSFLIRGVIPGAGSYIDYTIGGRWVSHPKYGEQFEVEVVEIVQPESREQILAFLSSGVISGVGEATAKLMVEVFGESVLEIMEHRPKQLMSLPGIGAKKMQRIHDSYMNTVHARKNLMFFYSIGISTNAAMKIMESLGENAVALLTENPYVLIETVRGFAFKKADAVAMKLGVAKDSAFRVRACITHIMREDVQRGHTYSMLPEVLDACTHYEIARELAEDVLFSMLTEMQLLLIQGDRLAFPQMDSIETDIAIKLRDLVDAANPLREDSTFVEEFEKRMGIRFDELQREAIRLVFSEGVYIVTGGPGTGKTTIVNAMIHAFEKQGREVLLCAPTGRAAKKMADATDRTARTIHRTLGSNGEFFSKNEDDPLKCDAVIVDEVSMIDVFLMNSLLKAIRPGTSVIFVGDKDQLPSVGAGSVLRDMLQSGRIKAVRLQHIFRQSERSMISVNAGRIIRGEMPRGGEDFFVFDGPDDLSDRVVELVSNKIPDRFGFDPMSDIQVLSVKYDGDAGVNELNRRLREVLIDEHIGKSVKTQGGREFCYGDKVMQTSNNYEIEWTDAEEQEGTGVFNGDIGRVVEIDVEDSRIKVEFEDGRIAPYSKAELHELTHAYAITVHKSQGSEYPCVVMPMYSSFTMENRNILYTAVTRAKRLVVLLGDRDVLRRFVNRINIDNRRSTLSEKLSQLFDAEQP